ADAVVRREALAPEAAQGRAGGTGAGADRVVVDLLVLPAGRVEAEDPPGRGRVVPETGQQRDDGEALHREPQLGPQHRGQPGGLALEGERGALDLLVVLELHLEEPHELERESRGPGNAD